MMSLTIRDVCSRGMKESAGKLKLVGQLEAKMARVSAALAEAA